MDGRFKLRCFSDISIPVKDSISNAEVRSIGDPIWSVIYWTSQDSPLARSNPLGSMSICEWRSSERSNVLRRRLNGENMNERCHSRTPICLHADESRLQQIFLNLLNNAAQYAEHRGRIRLAAEQVGNEAIVTVSDDGVFIAADKHQEIFEIFSKVDDTLHESHNGLGIGLMLVKRLTEMHGGSVAVSSAGPGQAANFACSYPSRWRQQFSHTRAKASVPLLRKDCAPWLLSQACLAQLHRPPSRSSWSNSPRCQRTGGTDARNCRWLTCTGIYERVGFVEEKWFSR